MRGIFYAYIGSVTILGDLTIHANNFATLNKKNFTSATPLKLALNFGGSVIILGDLTICHKSVSFLYEKIKITLSLWLTYSLVEF